MKTSPLRIISSITLSLLLCTSFLPVMADDQDALDATANEYNQNKKSDKLKVVCRKEAPVGTRIKRKVCRSVASMENSERNAQEAMSRLRTSVGNQQ